MTTNSTGWTKPPWTKKVTRTYTGLQYLQMVTRTYTSINAGIRYIFFFLNFILNLHLQMVTRTYASEFKSTDGHTYIRIWIYIYRWSHVHTHLNLPTDGHTYIHIWICTGLRYLHDENLIMHRTRYLLVNSVQITCTVLRYLQDKNLIMHRTWYLLVISVQITGHTYIHIWITATDGHTYIHIWMYIHAQDYDTCRTKT